VEQGCVAGHFFRDNPKKPIYCGRSFQYVYRRGTDPVAGDPSNSNMGPIAITTDTEEPSIWFQETVGRGSVTIGPLSNVSGVKFPWGKWAVDQTAKYIGLMWNQRNQFLSFRPAFLQSSALTVDPGKLVRITWYCLAAAADVEEEIHKELTSWGFRCPSQWPSPDTVDLAPAAAPEGSAAPSEIVQTVRPQDPVRRPTAGAAAPAPLALPVPLPPVEPGESPVVPGDPVDDYETLLA
jgi:hypothetical protein